MSEIKLTRDAKQMLDALYKSYKAKRESGKDKYDATSFPGCVELRDLLFPNQSPNDIFSTASELQNHGLIKLNENDDLFSELVLLNEGILYMEERFLRGIAGAIDAVAKLK